MFTTINGMAVIGIEGLAVRVEVDIAYGLRKCFLVGLPDGAIRESLRRVESALVNSGLEWPRGQITINLSPAGLRKDGTGFDLPIALALLVASGQIQPSAGRTGPTTYFTGELSLDGSVLPVPGVLPRATRVRDLVGRTLVVPSANVGEAAAVADIEVVAVDSLAAALAWLEGGENVQVSSTATAVDEAPTYPFDFAEVRGQIMAKRALEIAAAGGHNVLMIGPPGAGKTMLARRLVTILPPMTDAEAIETTTIHSVASVLAAGATLMRQRPFRAPHFTVSEVGLVGGGSGVPRPGEVSLAHNGVLFLDELPEFRRSTLEVLRGPLEDQQVTLTRAMATVTYPASLMLIAAMNPCPCGFFAASASQCRCSYPQVQSYNSRISGPLLDRIDLHTTVSAVGYSALVSSRAEESSGFIRARVERARQRQRMRLADETVHCNAEMSVAHLNRFCRLDDAGHQLMARCVDVLGVSARGYSRLLKVGRTIADLAGEEAIRGTHIAEAVGYRRPDPEARVGRMAR